MIIKVTIRLNKEWLSSPYASHYDCKKAIEQLTQEGIGYRGRVLATEEVEDERERRDKEAVA